MFGSRKLNNLVEYPVNGLDLSNFIINQTDDSLNPKQQNMVYDLYAVSNHYGSLNGGHYTAMCKNPVANSWFEFDDN